MPGKVDHKKPPSSNSTTSSFSIAAPARDNVLFLKSFWGKFENKKQKIYFRHCFNSKMFSPEFCVNDVIIIFSEISAIEESIKTIDF